MPGPTFDVTSMFGDTFHYLVERSPLNIKPRSRAAALPVVEENCAGSSRDGRFEISIFEDNVRRFASEFERNFFSDSLWPQDYELADFG